jgi:hypothetical protein
MLLSTFDHMNAVSATVTNVVMVVVSIVVVRGLIEPEGRL